MTITTFDQALTLVRQLTAPEQARLIAVLAEGLARQMSSSSDSAVLPTHDAWAQLFAFSDDIRATYPDAHPAARLEADRHSG